jgi:hypothetical protein
MSLEDLGNIGEFVAAVAVIVSLIYLAVQIRQNTTSVRLSNYLSSETMESNLFGRVVENANLARLYRIGRTDFDALNEDERLRFTALMSLHFRAYEQMFLQHRRGLIEPDVWAARREAMFRWTLEPGVHEMWKKRSHSFSEGFQELYEQMRARAGEDTGEADSDATESPSR